MNEFDLIQHYFSPLARNFSGSLNLTDDAALVSPPAGHELVITKDAISAGVHFIGDEDPALIAKKLLRTNLSDLAAKGAAPLCYFLSLMLPSDTAAEWVERFAQGLGEDQALFGIHLAGGDTIRTLGPASFSLTALGTVKNGTMLRRNAACAGDIIVVSGTLGDSALGLLSLRATLPEGLTMEEKAFLETRYLLPQPRLNLGQSLPGVAHAGMDISDGLVQDLGHICKASNVAAEIQIEDLPLSDAARNAIQLQPDLIALALSGGDDYELLFTVAPQTPVPQGCTSIGVMAKGSGVTVLDGNGNAIALESKGFQHFA